MATGTVTEGLRLYMIELKLFPDNHVVCNAWINKTLTVDDGTGPKLVSESLLGDVPITEEELLGATSPGAIPALNTLAVTKWQTQPIPPPSI